MYVHGAGRQPEKKEVCNNNNNRLRNMRALLALFNPLLCFQP